MEIISIDAGGVLDEIEINPSDETTEIAQAISALTATPKGNVPLERGMGLGMEYMHSNSDLAAVQMEAELAAAVEEYEPRAEVRQVSSVQESEGRIRSKVEVILNGG